jgi:hypothetical protein
MEEPNEQKKQNEANEPDANEPNQANRRKEPLNPGDEAPPDAPGVGEGPCHVCNGSGVVQGQPCTVCGGTGRILQGIGGG